jgi:pyrophosphatase PpaX
MVATYRSFNMEHHDALARPYAGVADQVRRIHSAGHKLGLVTSKMRSGALRGLELLQLTNAFHVIVAADEVTNPKPDPEPVLRAMGLLGCGAGETIFIGDSRHDLDCGRAAGVKTAAVLWGPFGRPELQDCCPDYWLEQPKDIERLYEAPIDQPIRRLMADG